MAITTNQHHDSCAMWIVRHPEKIHAASLVCKTHNTWVQWLSDQDMQALLDNNLAEIRPSRTKMISLDELGL